MCGLSVIHFTSNPDRVNMTCGCLHSGLPCITGIHILCINPYNIALSEIGLCGVDARRMGGGPGDYGFAS